MRWGWGPGRFSRCAGCSLGAAPLQTLGLSKVHTVQSVVGGSTPKEKPLNGDRPWKARSAVLAAPLIAAAAFVSRCGGFYVDCASHVFLVDRLRLRTDSRFARSHDGPHPQRQRPSLGSWRGVSVCLVWAEWQKLEMLWER